MADEGIKKKKEKKRPLVWQLKVVSMAELGGVIFQVRRG